MRIQGLILIIALVCAPIAAFGGNKAWEASMEQHLVKLKDRRADRCPEYNKQRNFLIRARAQAREIQKYVKAAGAAAAKYFSGGWL